MPELTSVYCTPDRGPWGDANYRGNCSGYLIRDLLRFFRPRHVLDPLTGGGTCRDVCRELSIPCTSFDLKSGRDACDPSSYADLPRCDFIWLHPPYWRMIRYSDDPRCLSNAPSLKAFKKRLGDLIANCLSVLAPRGKIAVLMGDAFDRELRRRMPLVHFTRAACLELGLWPAATDIVRVHYGNTSSRRSYATSFIPCLHDVCMVMERK